MLNRRQLIGAVSGLGLSLSGGVRQGFSQLWTQDQLQDPDIPVLGNPDGDVTLFEFFDYQCPYCKMGHPDVTSVVAEDGNVRLIMKDWPVFGDVSVFAAYAVLGANEIGAYESAMAALMATPGALTEEAVTAALRSASLDLPAISKAIERNERKISAIIGRNFDQAFALNFAGTPSFVIGKMATSGALDRDQLREAIRQARAG